MRKVALALMMMTAGCGRNFDEAHEAVKSSIKDPSTALFGEDIAKDGGDVCGLVNFRASDGQYVGFQRYVYVAAQHNAVREMSMKEVPAVDDPSDWRAGIARIDVMKQIGAWDCKFENLWFSKCSSGPMSAQTRSDLATCRSAFGDYEKSGQP